RIEAVVAAEIERAVAPTIVRVEIELLGLQAVRLVKDLHRAGARFEAHEAVVRAEPQSARGVRLDAVDHLTAHLAERRALEAHGVRVSRRADQVIDAAAASADPQLAVTIHVQRVDALVTDAARITIPSTEVMKDPRARIQQIQAAADGADPEIAV